MSTFSWYHAARRLRVPFVTQQHGTWQPRSAAYRAVATRAASVVCLTEGQDERLRTFLGRCVHADLVPNGLPVEAAGLLAARGLDFRWILCGAEVEPACAAAVRRQISEAALQDRVSLLGESGELPGLFAAAAIELATSPELRRTMGCASRATCARARVRQSCDVRLQARRLEAVYERGLPGTTGGGPGTAPRAGGDE